MDGVKPILTPAKKKLKLTKEEISKYIDSTYLKSLITSLRYLTSIDTFSVDFINRFIENSRQYHLKTTKRILRYTKDTQRDDILYSS